jgi:hypothetical protein
MRWAEYVVCMGYKLGVYMVLVGRSKGKRQREDPDVGGMVIIRCIFKKWGGCGMEWIDLAQNMERWWDL